MGRDEDARNVIIKQLLRDTLIMLCKNTLSYQTELCIEGLLGLTLDKKEIILVNIGETISKDAIESNNSSCSVDESQSVVQTISFQSNVKSKKRRTSRTTNFSLSSNGKASDTGSVQPDSGNTLEDSLRIQADFNLEKIEVKREDGETGDRGCNSGKRIEVEENEAVQQITNAETEYENDCYIESADVPGVQQNNYIHGDFNDVQNETSVLERNLDNFMSLDQKVFQEMFQADFAASSLTYNVEGLSSEGFEAPSRSTIERQVYHQRASYGKPDGLRSTGLRRRGYSFRCRYGYSRILHQCSQCPATFTMSSNLGRHMTTMHNMNGCGQSVFCPMCQKQFSRSDNLARHLKKVHKCDSPHMAILASANLTD